MLRFLTVAVDLAVASLGVACATLALAAQGGRWNARLDLLTHPAPLWVFLGLVAAGLSLLLVADGRARWTALAGGFLAVLGGLWLMAPDIMRLPNHHRASAGGQVLKVVELNAWQGNFDVERVARWIAAEHADVVIVVEASNALVLALDRETGLHAFAGDGAVVFTREKWTAGHIAWELRDLPGSSRPAFAWVEVPGNGRPYNVVGVHLGWPIPSREAWADDRKIAAVTQHVGASNLIMAGDFNSTQWSFRQRAADAWFGVERRDMAIPTWPARVPMLHGLSFPAPFLSIDHIYAGSEWRTLEVRRGPRVGSDHYPLVAVLERVSAR